MFNLKKVLRKGARKMEIKKNFFPYYNIGEEKTIAGFPAIVFSLSLGGDWETFITGSLSFAKGEEIIRDDDFPKICSFYKEQILASFPPPAEGWEWESPIIQWGIISNVLEVRYLRTFETYYSQIMRVIHLDFLGVRENLIKALRELGADKFVLEFFEKKEF